MRNRHGRGVSLLALAGSLAVLPAAQARAQAPETYGRTGPYIGAAGSVGIYTELENDLPGDGDVDEPIGANARVGYRFHPFFAAEVAGEWLPEADVEVFNTDAGSIESWTAMANLKAYLSTARIQPFGLVGAGVMFADADVDDAGVDGNEQAFAARFGGGFDFYLNANFVLAIEAGYVLPTGDLDELDHVSIGWGLAYRF
jgi:hypothetical protein